MIIAAVNILLLSQANPKLKIDDLLVKSIAQKIEKGTVNEMLFDDVQARVSITLFDIILFRRTLHYTRLKPKALIYSIKLLCSYAGNQIWQIGS